jgi:hypothetical protein
MSCPNRFSLCGIGALLLVLGGSTSAATVSPVTPGWSRSGAYATYQAWDVFSNPAGPNAPNNPGDPTFGPFVDQSPHNTNGVANVIDTSGDSFVTGGGNIYSPTSATHIKLTSPDFNLGTGYVTTVLLQIRTQGDEAVYSGAGGIRLTSTDAGGPHAIYPTGAAELNHQPLGGFGGSLVDYATRFELPFSAALLTFNVDAADTSMSFDRASIDTITTRASAASTLLPGMDQTIGYVPQAVPEPAAVGGIALLAGTLLRRRRRR